MSADPRTKTTIRVDNLHPSITEANLHDQFLPFGEIIEIVLSSEERDQRHQPYAHIEFEEAKDAEAALDNMHQAELWDRVISVTPARPTREVFEGLGSKVPLWEQEGFVARYMADNGQEGDAMEGLEQEKSMGQGALPVSVGPMPVGS